MKKYLLFALILVAINLNAQNSDNTVTITANGSGKTQNEAKQNALRSAIEQAYGAFISSKTEILNDQMVADEITSVASGNIQKYDILYESKFPDGSWGTTLKAIVSIGKLTSFAESKGFAIEIKGGLFAINIKQQMLNEEGEVKAILNMLEPLTEIIQNSFDYTITNGDPISISGDNAKWKIPVLVTVKANKNMDFCADYFIKSLSAIGLTEKEVENYKSLKKNIYNVALFYKDKRTNFYLRKSESIFALNTFGAFYNYFKRGYYVQSSNQKIKGYSNDFESFGPLYNLKDTPKQMDPITVFKTMFFYNNYFHGFQIYRLDKEFENIMASDDREEKEKFRNQPGLFFSFRSNEEILDNFLLNETKTLTEIEQLTGYSVKPNENKIKFKQGGFILLEGKNNLLFSIASLDAFRNNKEFFNPIFDQRDSREDLNKRITLYGKSWRFPTKDELNHLIKTELFYGEIEPFNPFIRLLFDVSLESGGTLNPVILVREL